MTATKTDRVGMAFTFFNSLPTVWCHGGVRIIVSMALGMMSCYERAGGKTSWCVCVCVFVCVCV